MFVPEFTCHANREYRVTRGSAHDVENESLERSSIDSARVDLVPLHGPRGQVMEFPTHATLGTEPKCHESLRLSNLGEGRPFDRPRIEDRCPQRTPIEIGRQDLMPMDMPGENGGEVGRDVAPANHIRRSRERKVARSYGRAFDAVVNAEKSMFGFVIAPVGLADECRELRPHILALVWEARERDSDASDVHAERARDIEDVDVRVRQESRVWKPRPLMVARNDEHGNAEVGDPPERLIRLMRDRRVGCGSVEDVAAVDDDIDTAREGRRERRRVVREEIESAPSAPNPRPDR